MYNFAFVVVGNVLRVQCVRNLVDFSLGQVVNEDALDCLSIGVRREDAASQVITERYGYSKTPTLPRFLNPARLYPLCDCRRFQFGLCRKHRERRPTLRRASGKVLL